MSSDEWTEVTRGDAWEPDVEDSSGEAGVFYLVSMLSGLVLDIAMVTPPPPPAATPVVSPATASPAKHARSSSVAGPSTPSSSSSSSSATSSTVASSSSSGSQSGRLARLSSVSNKIGGALGSLFSPTAAAATASTNGGARLEVVCRQRAAAQSSQRFCINSQGIIASKLSSGHKQVHAWTEKHKLVFVDGYIRSLENKAQVLECEKICCGIHECEAQRPTQLRVVTLAKERGTWEQKWKMVSEFDLFFTQLEPIVADIARRTRAAEELQNRERDRVAAEIKAREIAAQQEKGQNLSAAAAYLLHLNKLDKMEEMKEQNTLYFARGGAFDWVWDSKGTRAKTDVSVWRPQVPDGWIRFGDFAHVGYNAPVEKVVIARDHPTAFRKPDTFNLLWQKVNRGTNHFWAWEPVSYDPAYIAIGHCGSIDAKPPPVDCVRCVHISFLRAARTSYSDMIWSDHGTGGNEDASFWRAPDTNSFIVSDTYSPPSGVYYMLKTEGDILPNVQPGAASGSGSNGIGSDDTPGAQPVDPLPVGASLSVGGDGHVVNHDMKRSGSSGSGSGSGDESSPVVVSKPSAPSDPRDFKKKKDRSAPSTRRTRRSSMADETHDETNDDGDGGTPAAPSTSDPPSSTDAEKQRLKEERKRLRGHHQHSRLHRPDSDAIDSHPPGGITLETSSRAEGEPAATASSSSSSPLLSPGGSTTDGDMVLISQPAVPPPFKSSNQPLLSLEDDEEPGTAPARVARESKSSDAIATMGAPAYSTGESKDEKKPHHHRRSSSAGKSHATNSGGSSDVGDRKRNALDMPALAMARKTASTRLVVTTPAFSYTSIWEEEVKGRGWVSCWRPSLPEGHIMFGDVIMMGRDKPSGDHRVMIANDSHHFRKPMGYLLLWNYKRGKHAMYVWQPQAPHASYTHLGCVVTLSSNPPRRELVRCVPKDRTTLVPMTFQLWNDNQSATRKLGKGEHNGSIWRVPNLNTFLAAAGNDGKGHCKPVNDCFTLALPNDEEEAEAYRLDCIALQGLVECVTHLTWFLKEKVYHYPKMTRLARSIHTLTTYLLNSLDVSPLSVYALTDDAVTAAGPASVPPSSPIATPTAASSSSSDASSTASPYSRDVLRHKFETTIRSKVLKLEKEIAAVVFDDFSHNTSFSLDTTRDRLTQACELIDSLSTRCRQELITRIRAIQLAPYRAICAMSEREPADTLTVVCERHFAWLRRKIDEHNLQWAQVYPRHWHVNEHISHEFAIIAHTFFAARLANTALVPSPPHVPISVATNNMAEVVAALRLCLALEVELDRAASEHKFRGLLSGCFSSSLAPYIETDVNDNIRYVQTALTWEETKDQRYFNIDAVLMKLRNGVTKFAEINTRQALLHLTQGYGRCLNVYAKVVEARIPTDASFGRGGSRGRRVEEDEECARVCCIIINTMAYAASCLPVLKERVHKLLEAELHAAVDFSPTEETFLAVINKCLNVMKVAAGVQLTPSFIAMTKSDWTAAYWAPPTVPVRSDSHDRSMSIGGMPLARSPSTSGNNAASPPTSGTSMTKSTSGFGAFGEKLRTTGLDLFGSKKDKEKAAAAKQQATIVTDHHRSASALSSPATPHAPSPSPSPPSSSSRNRSPSPSMDASSSSSTAARERTRVVMDGEGKNSVDSDTPDYARCSPYLRAIIGFLAPHLAVASVKLPESYSQRQQRTRTSVASSSAPSTSTTKRPAVSSNNPFAAPDDFDMDSPTNNTKQTSAAATTPAQTNDWEVIADEEVPLVIGAADMLKMVQRMTTKAHYQSFCSMLASHIIALFSHHLSLCKSICEEGAHQLLLDLRTLKHVLLTLPNRGRGTLAVSSVVMASYTKYVTGEVLRVRNLLRCIASKPPIDLVTTFRSVYIVPPPKVKDLVTIMTLKGMRKADQAQAIDLFNRLTEMANSNDIS